MGASRLCEALERERVERGAVRAWSIHAGESTRLSVGVKDSHAGGAHSPPEIAEGAHARYLIVWDDGRVSRGVFERRHLEGDLDEALEHARVAAYGDPDAAHVLGPAALPEVELYDTATAHVARGDEGLVSERLREIRERVSDPHVRTWSASLSAGAGRSQLLTSAGFDAGAEGTSFGWHVTVNGEIGDGFAARAPESGSRFSARLDRLLRLAAELQHESELMPGGAHPLLLHPRVVREYVLRTLFHHLAGSTLSHGEGRFRVEDFGSGNAVLRDDLCLRLDPLRPLAGGSYRFTAEGVPAARCSYIEDGCLIEPVLDVKYGRRLGRTPTPLPQGSDTLELVAGETLELDEGLRLMGSGALVLSVLGAHTQDSASGDFSLSTPRALKIENGLACGRLRGTLSGNLFDVLRDPTMRLVAFEDEPVPGLMFAGRLDPA